MNTYLAVLFMSLSQTYNLPPGLLSSVCYVESKHVPAAMHDDDGGSPSIGLCQIKLGTARLLGFKGDPSSLRKAEVNARIAARYISHQLRRYNGDVAKAVSAYNAGTYRMSAKTRLAKNQQYVNKVFKAWGEKR